ncbi:DUF2971 domain-containing protein [Sphingomonas crocodyli]|uniref:DUF2971 domain-containing protein n=1 Tax=Sphingomonas crocodyli TaxID=1979270 RepID=A0A437M6P7_9SPHN|nr:DUF2971 domain-containing protein [Sphingomonas crocodyli]RVT93390.1 DUF2971 domain-containing protein [Sphingomonas crocodyli]
MTITVTFDGNPTALYKFWAMPGEGTQEESYLRDLLVGHKLFFQAAHKLNDPFDCLPAIYTAFTPDRAKMLFERHIRSETPDVTDADCAAEVERRVTCFDFSLVGTPEFQLGARDAFKEHREVMAVYCLSARVDSVLMWSHYAKNHTGFAVRFDYSDTFIGEAQRVRYVHKRPLIDPGSRDERNMYVVLLSKARDWKYEQEWRITRIGRPGLHKFNPKALTGIVFGMAMPQLDRDRLRALCGEGGFEPKFYQAVDDARSFNVQIVEV